jgi:hypothetical protein
MSENFQMLPNVEELKEQIRKLMADQAKAFADAVYIGMTAEFVRECDERRRKICDLVEILTQRYEQSLQRSEAAQVGVLSYLNHRLQPGNRGSEGARKHTFRNDRSHSAGHRRDR